MIAVVARVMPSWIAIHGSSPQKRKTAKLSVSSRVPRGIRITTEKTKVKRASIHSGCTKDHRKPITEPA